MGNKEDKGEKKPETNQVIQNNPEENQNNQHNENSLELNLNPQNNENVQNIDFQNKEKEYENNGVNIISSNTKKTGKFSKVIDSMLINWNRLRENKNKDVIKQIKEEEA